MRLIEHRQKLAEAGYTGPLLRIEELDDDELKVVNDEFFERAEKVQSADPVNTMEMLYDVYVSTLHSWGIICPHPQVNRVYGDHVRSHSPLPFSEFPWFTCTCCRAAVINR